MSLPVLVRTLSKPVPPRMLVNLEGALLLPFLLGFSQLLSMRVSRSRRAADEMVLRGARRWQELQSAAPRLRASLEQLLADSPTSRLSHTAKDIAIIRALVEFCLGMSHTNLTPTFFQNDLISHKVMQAFRGGQETRFFRSKSHCMYQKTFATSGIGFTKRQKPGFCSTP